MKLEIFSSYDQIKPNKDLKAKLSSKDLQGRKKAVEQLKTVFAKPINEK